MYGFQAEAQHTEEGKPSLTLNYPPMCKIWLKNQMTQA
jgi:hypothetical protein